MNMKSGLSLNSTCGISGTMSTLSATPVRDWVLWKGWENIEHAGLLVKQRGFRRNNGKGDDRSRHTRFLIRY
jgi:hypothetical protein